MHSSDNNITFVAPLLLSSRTSFSSCTVLNNKNMCLPHGRKAIATPSNLSLTIVKSCIEKPDPNAMINEQGESLVEAAMTGDEQLVNKLLSSESSPSPLYASIRSPMRMTALMWAVTEGHLKIAESLIKSGADINAKTTDGSTVLIIALENTPNANPRPAPPPGFPGAAVKKETPKQLPMVPRQSGHVDTILMLLNAGADWNNSRNRIDESCLHLACRRCQLPIIRQLLAKGADVNDRTNYGKESPIYIAAKENHVDVVKFLCNVGADFNAPNVFGWTPIIIAAASGGVDVVKALIEAGADVNVKASSGTRDGGTTTALKECRKSANPQEISILLARAGALE